MSILDAPSGLFSELADAQAAETCSTALQLDAFDEVDGVETEEPDPDQVIVDPFDPTKIRVEARPLTIDLLMARIREGELELTPGFQRAAGIWSRKAQSRLIESLLIRIPLPAFYVDATDDNRWLVVDGLQRLTAMRLFIVDGTLQLRGLEFLSDFEGKTFEQLPRSWQRRINETQVTVYQIHEMPREARFSIFKRINTGGLPLSAQEIRHALYQGRATDLLARLAESPEFLQATGHKIPVERMGDRECILRVLAFTLTPYSQYKAKDFDAFLNRGMESLNALSDRECDTLANRFRRAMRMAYDVMGKGAFRKVYDDSGRLNPINRALMESWACNLDRLSDDDAHRLVERREQVMERLKTLMRDPEFDAAISLGTGEPRKVTIRFEKVRDLIKEFTA